MTAHKLSPYLLLTEIGNHFRFDTDCIVSVTDSKFQFQVNIARGEESLSNFELSIGYTCYDGIGNEV